MDEFMETPMEQQEQLLTVDLMAREQLAEAARWARFLAIMGFIACGIMVVAGVMVSIIYSFVNRIQTRYSYSGRAVNTFNRSAFVGIMYVIMAVLMFFSCLYMFRFANKMRAALHEQSRDEMNESFLNLKKLFKYNGILTIVLVAFYVMILFAAMFSFLNR